MTTHERAMVRQLIRLTSLALLGFAMAAFFGWQNLEHSPLYMLVASGLLCIGLYFAVCGIDKAEAKEHWRVIVIAVTAGVLLKYCIIASCMFMMMHDWRYIVFAMAVTQIDPLSVAALSDGERLKPHTQTVLNAWAATDDPMTSVLTPIALLMAGYLSHGQFSDRSDWLSLLIDLLPFALALVIVGLVAWKQRFGLTISCSLSKVHDHETTKNTVAALAVIIGAPTRLFSLPAFVGWSYRPAWTTNEKLVARILMTTLGTATFLLGILLADSHSFSGGPLLGAVTFCSQAIATWCVLGLAAKFGGQSSAFSRRDKLQLALGQQNGITAILLALMLEPSASDAVATIGSAIVTINVLHFVCNWAFDRYVSHRL